MSQEKTSVGLEGNVSRRVEQRVRDLSYKSPDDCVNWDLKRYYWMLDVAEEGFRAVLSEAELSLLRDACRRAYMLALCTPNGIGGCKSQAELFVQQVGEALQHADLLERHSTVDAATLRERLEKMERLEVFALAEYLKTRMGK